MYACVRACVHACVRACVVSVRTAYMCMLAVCMFGLFVHCAIVYLTCIILKSSNGRKSVFELGQQPHKGFNSNTYFSNKTQYKWQ